MTVNMIFDAITMAIILFAVVMFIIDIIDTNKKKK